MSSYHSLSQYALVGVWVMRSTHRVTLERIPVLELLLDLAESLPYHAGFGPRTVELGSPLGWSGGYIRGLHDGQRIRRDLVRHVREPGSSELGG